MGLLSAVHAYCGRETNMIFTSFIDITSDSWVKTKRTITIEDKPSSLFLYFVNKKISGMRKKNNKWFLFKIHFALWDTDSHLPIWYQDITFNAQNVLVLQITKHTVLQIKKNTYKGSYWLPSDILKTKNVSGGSK